MRNALLPYCQQPREKKFFRGRATHPVDHHFGGWMNGVWPSGGFMSEKPRICMLSPCKSFLAKSQLAVFGSEAQPRQRDRPIRHASVERLLIAIDPQRRFRQFPPFGCIAAAAGPCKRLFEKSPEPRRGVKLGELEAQALDTVSLPFSRIWAPEMQQKGPLMREALFVSLKRDAISGLPPSPGADRCSLH
jgi:hypothetical protein